MKSNLTLQKGWGRHLEPGEGLTGEEADTQRSDRTTQETHYIQAKQISY